jgi:hypothetical protein
MHIQVVSAKDGRHELITLTDVVEILRGEKMNRLVCGTIEHWFRKDGTYDGWGLNLEGTNLTPDEIRAKIESVEKSRMFP